MATVTTKLSLTSTDLLSQSLNLSVSKAITATATTGLARKAITSTAKGTASGQVSIHTAADFTAPAFLPANNAVDLKAYAVTSGTIVEFMVFGTEA